MADTDGEKTTGLAMLMVENLAKLTQAMERQTEITEVLVAKIDELCGYHETIVVAMENLLEQADEGKSKFNMADFAKAMVVAAEEVMPGDGDGGDEDDEPGSEDPRIRVL